MPPGGGVGGTQREERLFLAEEPRGFLGDDRVDRFDELVGGDLTGGKQDELLLHPCVTGGVELGVPGHADRSALLRWLGNLNGPPRRVFVTHGEEEGSLALAQYIDQQMKWPAHVPVYEESVDLD